MRENGPNVTLSEAKGLRKRGKEVIGIGQWFSA